MYGAFNTMHHASAYWRNESKEGRQPRASIINTVSSAGLQGQASQINYGGAKAAVAAMTIIASLELKRYGVRANCIGPGGATRMVAQAMKIEVKNPEDYTEFEAMNPGNSAPGCRVARVRRVAARDRSGVPPRRQQPRALPGLDDGRAVPRHREGRLAQAVGSRPTSAASSTATRSAAKPRHRRPAPFLIRPIQPGNMTAFPSSRPSPTTRPTVSRPSR